MRREKEKGEGRRRRRQQGGGILYAMVGVLCVYSLLVCLLTACLPAC